MLRIYMIRRCWHRNLILPYLLFLLTLIDFKEALQSNVGSGDSLRGNVCTKVMLQDKNGVYIRRAVCQRNQLQNIPLINNPDEIIDFQLNENKIKNLHDNSFLRYVNVTYLSLELNHLEKISDNTFVPLKKLQMLDVSKNYLNITNNKFLVTLDKLQELRMGGNRFVHLTSGFFKPLTSLRILDLDGTLGLYIREGAFTGLYKLTELNLHNCNLKTLANTGITSRDMSMMPLKRLHLDSNDWVCDCHLRWLASWYKEKQGERNDIEIVGNPVCKSPLANPQMKYSGMNGQKLFDSNTLPTKFQCQPVVKPVVFPNTGSHVVQEGDNVTFICVIYSDPKGETIWSKDNTKIFNKPRFSMRQSTGINFTATLTIERVEASDSGTYMCRAINTRGAAELEQVLTVRATKRAAVNSKTVAFIAIVALVVVTVTVIICGVFLYHYFRSNRPRRKTPTYNTQVNYRQIPPQDARRQQAGGVRYELPPAENGYSDATKKRVILQQDGGVDGQTLPLTVDMLDGSDTERAKVPSGYMTIRPATSRTSTLSHSHAHSDGSNCPVHGSRQLFGCPVHGESRSATPQLSGQSYGTLPSAGTNRNYNTAGKPCPLHGDFISTMTRRPHSPPNQSSANEIMRQKFAGASGPTDPTTYVRASKVDDCISIPEGGELPLPPPPAHQVDRVQHHSGHKPNPQDDEGYSTAV